MKKVFEVILLLAMTITLRVSAQEKDLTILVKDGIRQSLNTTTMKNPSAPFDYLLSGLMANSKLVYTINDAGTGMDSIIITDAAKGKIRALKHDTLYGNNILTLINGSRKQKTVGYSLICCLRDTAYYDLMWQRFAQWNNEEAGILFACLVNTFPKETDRIFNILEQHEQWGDAIVTQQFVRYADKPSLIHTFYTHLDDTIKMARIFSFQSIASLDPSAQADTIVIKALREWGNYDKGFAISALQYREKIHKKPLLMPYANDDQLHRIVVETLCGSDYKEDNDYARQIATKEELEMNSRTKEMRAERKKMLSQ